MRFMVGGILITAATLKIAELMPTYISLSGIELSRLDPLKTAFITIELCLGFTAFSRLLWRQTRIPILLLLLCFSGYSLFMIYRGIHSCGCFGKLQIAPWWVFILDISMCFALIADLRAEKRYTALERSGILKWNGWLLITIAGTVFIILIDDIFSSTNPRTSIFGGALTASREEIIVLEPDKWIGQQFPLIRYIGVDVSRGDWILLFHNHDCRECQLAVSAYKEAARLDSEINLAIVEVPPYDIEDFIVTTSANCHFGRLNKEKEWFIETPQELQLSDGIVISASSELSFIGKSALDP